MLSHNNGGYKIPRHFLLKHYLYRKVKVIEKYRREKKQKERKEKKERRSRKKKRKRQTRKCIGLTIVILLLNTLL